MRFFKLTEIVIILVLAGCGQTQLEMISTWKNNKDKFDEIVRQFQKEPLLNSISLAIDGNALEMVNGWSFRQGYDSLWENWSEDCNCKIYLKSLDAVLKKENISMERYSFYKAFLEEYRFSKISKFDFVVEIEAVGNGLHFVSDKDQPLREDHEYLYVKPLTEQWFYYERDWN